MIVSCVGLLWLNWSRNFFLGVVDCQDWDANYYMRLVDKNGGGLN